MDWRKELIKSTEVIASAAVLRREIFKIGVAVSKKKSVQSATRKNQSQI